MGGSMTVQEVASALEQHLGSPTSDRNEISFAAALDYDDRAEYPYSMMAALHAGGLHEYQIPVAYGGRAVDLQQSFEILRLVARRDVALATSFATTCLGLMPVLVAGTAEQKAHFGGEVCRGAQFAWALSERAHGSDVGATSTHARRVEGGYLVNGEKWPIGNSAVGDVVAIFARTADRPGPTAYSVLMLDRHSVARGSMEPLRRDRLHGVRAIDTGGLRLTDCFVPDAALIGREGQGLEIALKSSLAARTMVPALALGAADTALRRTLDFCVEREIFGRRLSETPVSRRRVAEAFADILLSDALAIASLRTLHTAPGQSSVTSSVSKFLVPTQLERTVSDLATVLGARHYIRGEPRYGIFGKMMRDLWIAHFAEGNTVVNLKNVAVQLGALIEGAVTPTEAASRSAVERTAVTCDLEAALPAFDPGGLDLRSRDGDDLLIALPATLEKIRNKSSNLPQLRAAARLGERFLAELRRVGDRYENIRRSMGRQFAQSAELYALAEQYCTIHAAACLLHISVHTVTRPFDPAQDAALLLFCLERLWHRFYPLEDVAGPEVVDTVAELALGLRADSRLFSHRRLVLAEGFESGNGAGQSMEFSARS